jgi:hypothetical protein
MRLRYFLLALLSIACSKDAPTEIPNCCLQTAPAEPSVSATSRVVPIAGVPGLEVSATVANHWTSLDFRVNTGPQCPRVVFYADSTGAGFASTGCPMGTTAGAPTLDLVPGDSIVIQRVLLGTDLAAYQPGLYHVFVEVSTDRLSIGLPTGTLRLPLTTVP